MQPRHPASLIETQPIVQVEEAGAVFHPEDLTRIEFAFHLALDELRGRPAWRRKLGLDQMRQIIALSIMANARSGLYGNVCLSALALADVRSRYVASIYILRTK